MCVCAFFFSSFHLLSLSVQAALVGLVLVLSYDNDKPRWVIPEAATPEDDPLHGSFWLFGPLLPIHYQPPPWSPSPSPPLLSPTAHYRQTDRQTSQSQPSTSSTTSQNSTLSIPIYSCQYAKFFLQILLLRILVLKVDDLHYFALTDASLTITAHSSLKNHCCSASIHSHISYCCTFTSVMQGKASGLSSKAFTSQSLQPRVMKIKTEFKIHICHTYHHHHHRHHHRTGL